MQENGGQPRGVVDRAAILAGAAVLLLFWALVQLCGLGEVPFHTKGEPREGIVVQAIVERGEWILPRRNGVELPRKPPLFHWLGALASHLHGRVDEWSVRLPSALLSAASALVLYGTTVAVIGPRAGLIAGLTLLTSFEWLRAATSARVDMTLAFGLTLSFGALLLHRVAERPALLVPFYTGSAWATLAKGPIGVALPLLQVVLLSMVDRGTAFARSLRLLRGSLLVLVVTVSWYGLALLGGGEEFFATQVLDENVFRLLGDPRLTGGHRHSTGYLALMLLVGFLPWTVFLPAVALALWKGRHALGRRDPRLFAVLWSAMVFAFHAFPASKRGVYLLPLYPSLCFLLGWWADAAWRKPVESRGVGFLGWIASGVLGGLVILCLLPAGGLSPSAVVAEALTGRAAADARWLARLIGERGNDLAVLFGLALLPCLFVALGRVKRLGSTLSAVLLATSAVITAARQVVLPHFAAERTPRILAARVSEVGGGSDRLSFMNDFDYGVVFYLGGRVPVQRGLLAAAPGRYLLTSEAEWQRATPSARRLFERIPGVESRHSGNLGRIVLLRRLTEAEPRR
jgi:4-amino-4-deoxy-L-arabinose transferase-like glycosyltransferase